MSGNDPIQRLDFNDEDIDVDEGDESGYENGPLYNKIYEIAEKFAGTYAGQYATGKIDSLLKLIEATAKWSLPPRNKSEPNTPLERPLPWIPFIALILMLRLVRIGLSLAGLFIGNAPIVPSDVVYFMQTRRRKLRAIRIAGMKEIRKKEEAQRHNNQIGGVLSRLTSIMSMAICRPKLCEDSQKILLNENCIEVAGSSGVKKTQQNHTAFKQQCFEDEDVSDKELTFGQMLDKYGASSNEGDDSDYVPPNDALNDFDTSSTSSATSDEEKNNEEEIESTENVAVQSISNNNPNSDIHMTNGNISIENQDQSVSAKENGEHLDKKLRKPKVMPKPIKDEPLPLPIQEVKQEQAISDEDTNITRIEFGNSEGQNLPLPIQEIKQEPVDSDEGPNRTKIEFENSESQDLPVPIQDIKQEPADSDEDTNISNDCNPHQKQQSIAELENDCKASHTTEEITENGGDLQTEKINGNQKLLQPEIFVTPATSAEDLFFSPVGSPDLCGAYGFQPTSILKNCQAVNLEKRGHTEAFSENEDFIKGEKTNELEAASRPTKNANHTGKPIKNKFRGKRR